MEKIQENKKTSEMITAGDNTPAGSLFCNEIMLNIGHDLSTISAERDSIVVWNEFLRWSCDNYDIQGIDNIDNLIERFNGRCNDNKDYFKILNSIHDLFKSMNTEDFDGLGYVYEKMFQTSSKAKDKGQFFTPASVCKIMSDIVNINTEITSIYDCACGSGRTLMSSYAKRNNKKCFVEGWDLDSTSVYMCALNFLFHGMIGLVSCIDTLEMDFKFGYIINPLKAYGCENIYSIQRIENREKMLYIKNELIKNMKNEVERSL